ADSLSKAVGGDAALAGKVAPHLAEIDKLLKTVSEERAKMMPAGGGPPDQSAMQGMREKMMGYRTQVDTHLKAIRDLLDGKQPAEPVGATGAALVEPSEEHIRRLTDELAQLKDQYLRLAADHDNFRRRAGRERTEAWSRAQAEVVSNILDALDDLGRVAHLDA